MPHYFFHASDGASAYDHRGTNLRDEAEARGEALRYAGEMLKFSPDPLAEHNQLRVMVQDETGALLFTVVTILVEVPAPQRRIPSDPAND